MRSASRLKESWSLLESLFSLDVVVEASCDDSPVEPLHPLEANFVRDAVPLRQREFAMGRACARRALARLGVENGPLLPGHDRAPLWPSGIVGSISHCEGFCAVAVARRDRMRSIGLDVELRMPLDVGLVQAICTPGERVALARMTALPGADWAAIVFSAKESFFKCVYSFRPRFLDFQDVEIVLEPERGAFRACVGRDTGLSTALEGATRGRFALDERCIFTAVTLAGPHP
jgi:enterobactin synthetase component D / holo-[acyl-carrier protein] synthase